MKLGPTAEAILLEGARQIDDDQMRDRYFARVAEVLRPIVELRGWAFGEEVRVAVEASLQEIGG